MPLNQREETGQPEPDEMTKKAVKSTQQRQRGKESGKAISSMFNVDEDLKRGAAHKERRFRPGVRTHSFDRHCELRLQSGGRGGGKWKSFETSEGSKKMPTHGAGEKKD